MRPHRTLGIASIALGTGLAASAVLGPLVLAVIRLPISPNMENQVVGGDVASLAVAAPLAVASGVLWLRGHRLAPALSLAPALYAIYYAVSLVAGVQYERYPGNIERFFPLYLGLTILGWAIAAKAWSALPAAALPEPGGGLRRTTAGVLIALGGLLGLAWAKSILGVASGSAITVEYLGDPNVYWTIKLLDTAFIIPLALATGVSLLRHSATARKAAYGVTGYLTCQGAAVAGMAAVMAWRDDPAASVPFLVLSVLGTVALAALTTRWLWLYEHGPSPTGWTPPTPGAAGRRQGRLAKVTEESP